MIGWFRRKPASRSGFHPTGINDQVIWTVEADGTRKRLFCLKCREQGKDWLSPTPCVHMSGPGQDVKVEQIRETVRKLEPVEEEVPQFYDGGPVDGGGMWHAGDSI